MDYLVQDTSLTAVADAIRAKAGGSDLLTFPAGMVEAISGISSGGGLKYASGTVVPAEDMLSLKVTGLGFTPKFFTIKAEKDRVLDSVAKLAAAIYCNGTKVQIRTNSNGSSLQAVDIQNDVWETYEVLPDDTNVNGMMETGVLTTGFYSANSSYKFKAGYTYYWEAWGE